MLSVDAVRGEDQDQPLKILHLSDLHLGPPFEPKVADRLVEAATDADPDVLVVSGDFTQRAKRREFESARVLLGRLPFETRVLVPGNHDVPLYRIAERFLTPYALYEEFICSERDTVVQARDATFVGLDSTDPYRTIKNGRVDTSQLDFCTQAFSTARPDAFRVVVLHHHLVPAPTYNRPRPIRRAQRTLEALTRLRVDLVLAGHLHRAYVGNSLDVYAGADRDHGVIVVHCGTSTSRRGRGLEREKNSFNIITLSGRRIIVTHYMFFGNRDAFEPVSRHEYARGGRLTHPR